MPSKQRAPADPKSGGPSLSLHGLGWALALATPSFFPDLVDINNTPAEIANSFDARAGFLTPGGDFRLPTTRRRAKIADLWRANWLGTYNRCAPERKRKLCAG